MSSGTSVPTTRRPVLVAGAVVGALLLRVHLAAGSGPAGAVLVGVTVAGRASVRPAG